MVIIPEGTDAFMEPCNLQALNLIAVAALCFSGQQALFMFQLLQELCKRLRVRDMPEAI